MVNPVTTAAIGFGFSAVGWLISPVLSRFLNRCFDELGIDLPPEFQSKKQILLEKLEELETTLLPQLLVLTDVAHQSPHRRSLEKWIQKLKSAFYEAEHVLGLVEYERLEAKVNSLFPSFTSKNLLEHINDRIQRLSPHQNNNLIEDLKNKKKSIEESLQKHFSDRAYLIKSIEKLEKIVNEGMESVALLTIPSSGVNNLFWRPNEQHSKTNSNLRFAVIGREKDRDDEITSNSRSLVIGRDKDRDDIVNLLWESSSESISNVPCYSVIGLWGMGGSGKTTLARHVFKFEENKIKEKNDKHFDLVIWAHVSQEFSISNIFEKIWESAFKEVCPTFKSLEGLQSKLGEKLRDQKFFLVLDDVWDKGVTEQKLEQLFAPLSVGKRGSKILVTTRIEATAKALGAMNPIPLRELEEDQFFSLFMSNALGNALATDELINIGKEIASKLHRSPLAANIVGGQLRREVDTEFWKSVKNRSLLNDTMGSLFLSYQHLSSPLQRCFAFCSLFRKGYLFERDHLISLWIAEGFIERENTSEHMKHIANRYITELVSCSFFQVDDYGSIYMHDLMHDLAQHVSQGECFRIESNETKEIPIQTRHLYVVADMFGEYVEQICKLNDLCTLMVVCGSYSFSNLKKADLDSLFQKLGKLSVVELPDIEGLPQSVSYLKNLRYLSFQFEKELDAKPLNRLYQLRSIFWRYSEPKIPDVGRLILLEDMDRFYVQTEKGCDIKQLKHLNNLFGSLSIYGLHLVESKEEAEQAKLLEKEGLRNLRFCWGHKSKVVLGDDNVDVEVLNGLCPPPQIKELNITGYDGKRLPDWFVKNNDNIIHLKSLKLCTCRCLEALPKINELSNLKYFTIFELPRLKSWEPLPLNIIQLRITECLSLAFALKEELEMITSANNTQIVTFSNNSENRNYLWDAQRIVQHIIKLGGDIDEQAFSTISNDLKGLLEKLIEHICQLKNIYGELYLPPKLEKLHISSCFITNRVLARSLQGLNSLIDLTLRNIITITCITDEVLTSLTSLRNLVICNCLMLTSVGGWDTHSTLEDLSISECPNLTLKASVFAKNYNTVELASSSCMQKTSCCALKFLGLKACMSSDDSFQNLVSLERLVVRDCPTVANHHMGNMMSLIYLVFCNCQNLISLRGLSELDHLEYMEMIWCPMFKSYSDADVLTRLKELSIQKLSHLEQLISRDGFSSLISLVLYKAEEEYYSQEECEVFCHLSSLERISFENCKMHMLPNLLGLHTLRSVRIIGCGNLTSLSELPPSVQSFSILDCSEDFTKSCRDPANPNWQQISHIPKKKI